MTTESEPFLQRWSKRKLAAQQTAKNDLTTAPSKQPLAVNDSESSTLPPIVDPPEKPLTDADMPSLDSVTPQTDMQPFFSEGVSEELRQKAFRALFKQAQFNQCDGMDIYARNYNDFKPLGDIIPHDLQRSLIREAQAALEKESTETPRHTPEPAKIETEMKTENKS
jgi:hypothetical protein